MDVTAEIGVEAFEYLGVFVIGPPVHDEMQVLTGASIGEILNEPLYGE